MKNISTAFEPLAVAAGLITVLSLAAVVGSAFCGRGESGRGSGATPSEYEPDMDDPFNLQEFFDETELVARGSVGLPPAAGPSDIESRGSLADWSALIAPYPVPAAVEFADGLDLAPFTVGGRGRAGSYGGQSYSYWSAYYAGYREAFGWMQDYFNTYYGYEESSRQWLIPDSNNGYLVYQPGALSMYDGAGGRWSWRRRTRSGEVPSGDPVTTASSVSVIFHRAETREDEDPSYTLVSFRKDTGAPLFRLALPPGTLDVTVTEKDDGIRVKTCAAGEDGCAERAFPAVEDPDAAASLTSS